MEITKSYLDELTYKVNAACIEVHKIMGPGLLESVYHKCLKIEFRQRGINFLSEMDIPVIYKGEDVSADFRCDFIIEGNIILEIKSVETIKPIFKAQLFTYMKLTEIPKGILINFNVENLMKEGKQTFVNEIFRHLPD